MCAVPPGAPVWRNPITGIDGCCARVASGRAAAVPPSSVMNSRRFMSDMGLLPRTASQAAGPCSRFAALSLTRSDRYVLGADVNRSESRGPRLLPLRGWSGAYLDFAHVGGFAADEEVVARRREEIDHLRVFAEPSLVLCTCWNNH